MTKINHIELKEIKKEILALPSIQDNLQRFQDSWFKPLSQNNLHLPFIKGLDPGTKQELNQVLLSVQDHLQQIQLSDQINDRLHRHAHQLVELKLTSFNGDRKKSKMLTNDLSKDDTSIHRTVNHIQRFKSSTLALAHHYEEVSQLLEKKLSLEEAVFYMSLPHKKYLTNLLKIADHHEKIVRDLSHHFVTIADELQAHKNMHH
ncbi:MAG: hypothetical protein WCV90_00605 [Candidatus Woesearchaeota archaeon]|jgi:hypothetical protein